MIAAVVVNWNGRELLIKALTSLEASEGVDVRIILVDNGSTDGSVEAVRLRFPDTEIIANDLNLGFAAANNQGITLASNWGAEFTFLLNNDATVAPDCLMKLSEFLHNNPAAAAVSPYIFYHTPPDLIWFGGGRVWMWGGFIGHRHLRKRFQRKMERPWRSGYLTGCAMLARTRILTTIGGFDISFGHYSEDVDLSLRMRNLGGELWVLPSAKANHRVSASTGGMTPLKAYHRARSNMIFFRRHTNWYQWPGLIIAGLLLNIGLTLRMILKGDYKSALGHWIGLSAGLFDLKISQRFQLK